MEQSLLGKNLTKKEEKKLWKVKKERTESEMLGRLSLILLAIFLIFCVGIGIANANAEEVEYPTIGYLTDSAVLYNFEGGIIGEMFANEPLVITEEYDSRFAVISKEEWETGTREPEGYIDDIGLQFGARKSVTLQSNAVAWAIPCSVSMGILEQGEYQILGNIEDTICIWSTEFGVVYVEDRFCSEFKEDENDLDFLMSVRYPEEEFEPEIEDEAETIEELPPNQAKVVVNLASAYNEIGGTEIGKLQLDEVVEVLEWGDEYTQIKYPYSGITLKLYVRTEYLGR
jgi:hypothetical protein